jgi:hypothetical protein
MAFASALYAHLAAADAVVDLVGDRICPVVGPSPQEPNQPYPDTLVFRLDGLAPELSITWGRSEATRWTLTALSMDHATAHAIAEAVKRCLHTYYGPMGGAGGYLVKSSSRVDAKDEFDPEYSLFAVESVYELVYVPIT